MAKLKGIEAREAKYGEKMIEVKVRFWTDGLSEPGQIIPKHGLTGGVVRMKSNKTHGIDGGKARVFNSLLDVGAVIEKVLIDHGIVLHVNDTMKRYVAKE
jgi:hypothetical protein